MAESPTKWTRRLLRPWGRGVPAPAHPGVAGNGLGLEALVSLERLVGAEIVVDRNLETSFVDAGHVAGAVSATAAIAEATGIALGGRRATAFVAASGLPSAMEALAARAADRQVSLVVHAVAVADSPGDAPTHGPAIGGAIVLAPQDVQHAVDLAQVARAGSENSLTPVLLVVDSAIAMASESLRLPKAGWLRETLGAAADRIEPPTAAQKIVFGDERRRLPRWFDPDRPLAQTSTSGLDLAAVAAGRSLFFGDALGELAAEASRRFERETGRAVTAVTRFRMDDARHVLIATGATVALAEWVASELRRTSRLRIGVLGIVRTRPFPSEEVRDALARIERVTVIDPLAPATAGTATLRSAVQASLSGVGPEVLSATGVADARGLEELCRNMELETPREAVVLGPRAFDRSPRYPRQEVLLQRVRRDFPDLDRRLLPVGRRADRGTKGTCKLVAFVRRSVAPLHELERIADAMRAVHEGDVRGHVTAATPHQPDLWRIAVAVSGTGRAAPDPGVPADLVVIEHPDAMAAADPLGELRSGGQVVLLGVEAEVARRLPPTWARTLAEESLEAHVSEVGTEPLPEAIAGWSTGGGDGLRRIDVAAHDAGSEATPTDPDLPLAVRRLGRPGETLDSTARFWGEFAQPRLECPGEPPHVDPFGATGYLPAGTSTFQDRTASRDHLPAIDPDRCTACGRCWTSCPDSALGPVALGTAALLEQAATAADPTCREDLARLRRVHKQLAARIDGQLANAGEWSTRIVRESFAWLLERMAPADDERTGLERAFEAEMAWIDDLPLSVTTALFVGPHRKQKGDGELFLLASNPQSCQGCGICAEVCPDDAIRETVRDADSSARMLGIWRTWEQLPDTPGRTIARELTAGGMGPLASVLLSRHCLFALTGGDAAEPGSGPRLAVRQIAAGVEYRMQQRMLAERDRVRGLRDKLDEEVRAALLGSITSEHGESVREALEGTGDRASLASVLDGLQQGAGAPQVDARRLRGLLSARDEMERQRRAVEDGGQGAGRARFGVVLAGRRVAHWAARFPFNPFAVPVVLDLGDGGPALISGIARGLQADRIDEVRAARRAELLLENPPDLRDREEALDRLAWSDLTAEERGASPPLLLVGAAEDLVGDALSGLSRILGGELPIRVVALDGANLTAGDADLSLLGLAHRTAFTLSSSIAHPDHLFEGCMASLDHDGPALLHVHAPGPVASGVDPSRTVERARLAVRSRVHPLLRYDPDRPGVFGLRLNLDGNPESGIDADGSSAGSDLTPAHWAVGDVRFAADLQALDASEAAVPLRDWLEHSPDERVSQRPTVPGPNGTRLSVGGRLLHAVEERIARWKLLREWSGLDQPFGDAVRGRIEASVEERHAAELAQLRSAHAEELQRIDATGTSLQATRLRQRLLQLAGISDPAKSGDRT